MYEFDPRWPDDPRDQEQDRDISRGSSDGRGRESVDPRDVFIYHVRHRELYEAIGEPESRLRRPPAVPRALERLMVLDAILENPDIVWLSSHAEKVAHLTTLTKIPIEDLPHVATGQGDARQVRYFPDRVPLGVHPAGRVVLVYLHADPLHDDFRGFLQRHAAMLARLPRPGRSGLCFQPTWRQPHRYCSRLCGASSQPRSRSRSSPSSAGTSSSSPPSTPSHDRLSTNPVSNALDERSNRIVSRCCTAPGDRLASAC